MDTKVPSIAPRPARWPHRADPPQRYWGNYQLYQLRGGQVRLEDDIKGLLNDRDAYGDISRFYFFCVAFDQLVKEGVKGDIAELGAYKGDTATVLATMARRMGTTAWILDTFEGFNSNDLQGVDAVKRIEFEDTSLEAVRARVGEENVRYIQGYFPQSAQQMPDDLSFCLVHIDCDLYAPMCAALDYFYPRLLPGGYLIIHDYGSLEWDGAEKAVDEFFADKPEAPVPLTDGAGSVVIRRMRRSVDGDNWLARVQCQLFSTEYVSAARGALCPLLGGGWSLPELWGIWGVGPARAINLVLPEMPLEDVIVELDVAAAVVGTLPERTVDVIAGGTNLGTWTFTKQTNRSRRRIIIPCQAALRSGQGSATIELEFRPHVVARVSDLDPAKNDDRALGLALWGLQRVR